MSQPKKKDGTPLVDQDDNPFVVAVYNLDPSLFPKKYQDLAGPVPLMIAERRENGWRWEKTTLSKLSNLAGIKIGSEYRPGPHFYEELNQATVGVYWRDINPVRGIYNFIPLDQAIRDLKQHNMSIRSHALVFPTASYAMPDWLKNGSFSKEELTEILTNHIKNVVSHGKEQGIREWVVVNEPYLRPGLRDDDIFYKTFGNYDYIEIAFKAAREADPSARLIYNDTDNHDSGGLTTSLTRQIIQRLKSKGLVDAVGVQAHLGDWAGVPDSNDVINTLRSYGLPVIVTEFDYSLRGVRGSQEERNLNQAQVYKNFFKACLKAGVTEFTFWGIDDKNSWLANQRDAAPTIFDEELFPKLAYFALTETLFSSLLDTGEN